MNSAQAPSPAAASAGAPARPGARIGISLGDMGTLTDGLGEVARQLGQHVAGIARTWREQRGVRFAFHCRDHLHGVFGDEVEYLPVSKWQRLRHVQPLHYDVWHSVHQLNKNLPPSGAGTRIVTFHDLNYLYAKGTFSRWRAHRRACALVRRTDLIVTVSEYTAADVRRHLGWRGPLTVIHNGVRRFDGVEPEPLPGFAPAGPSRPFLFHLSRMSRSKNPEAILGLAAAWPEMDFVMCGPPTDEARSLKAANRLPNVQFHLLISEGQKAWAFGHCAGFLFPSLTEGFGLPPVEAMQFGKPVFLSRRTSLPEVGGEAAFYFDDFDPAAMRAVVEAGLARGAAPARIAEVRAQAARFDVARATGRYTDLYLSCLGEPR